MKVQNLMDDVSKKNKPTEVLKGKKKQKHKETEEK